MYASMQFLSFIAMVGFHFLPPTYISYSVKLPTACIIVCDCT